MNKAFRIVWSHVRNAFVVVDEHTSARGKLSGGTLLLAGAGLSLIASGAQASAFCGGSGITTTISNAETYTCYLYSGSSATVTNTGSLTVATDPAVLVYSGTFGTISNAGSIVSADISSMGDPSAAILLEAGEGVLTGTSISNLAGATIQGAEIGIYADGQQYDITLGHIDNAGTILGTNVAGVVLIGTSVTNGITNSGLISGGGYGMLLGDASTSLINNSGTITGGWYGLGVMQSIVEQIDNSGTISSDGAGLVADSGSAISHVNNSGTISGEDFAIQLLFDSHIDRLTNSGTISSPYLAIAVAEDGSSIDNIDITGTKARVIGDVFSTSSTFTLKSGATFSNENAYAVDRFVIENGATLRMGTGTSSSGELDAGITTLSGFSNAGTLSLAAGVTGTIHGNYSQASSGTLKIGVASDSSYGKLVVDGTAKLASNAKIVVDVSNPNYAFSAKSLQDVLSATTLQSDGTFAVSDNSQLFNFSAVKDGNTVDLTLAKAASVLDSVQSTGNNPAEGAANVLDEAIENDPNGELAANFVGLTSEQEVSDAVTQTLPTVAGNTSNATGRTLAGINRIIQSRQGENSGLSSGDAPLSEQNLWIKTFGSWADQDERSGISGYDADTKGLAIGADAAVSETTRLGLAFAYAETNVDSDSSIAPQDAQIDTFQLIGYGSYALAPDTELNFQLDAGQNRNESTRHMPFAGTTAKADYDGYNVHAGIGIGHSLRLSEQLTFVPSVRADYTWIESESYHEKGAGALNLDVDSNDAEELLLSVDGKVDYSLSEATVLSANLGAGYDVIDEDSSITSTYAGAAGAAFKTPGMDMEPWLARAGLGLTHTLEGGTEVSLRYDAEARSDFTQQGASLKARWAF
ncbi:autotransporter domain-containing protein [Pseudomonas sp. Gutcm_11s]|uniref:autotransporter domain-containing protein n=1 Tax=Pseudomonas sp. Gutcm_11s TaxID=3026088 RepID=UPI00235F9E1A|nr:autotransporter domain-containing protein [Pseudomonas sp. Gutcm_11s]MDD0842651.1 autotransporter domain-containing protein [Pseudomonas sp. Gutcm_11s]